MDFETMVRDRAYALWENEGRPEGREYAHWVEACCEVAKAMEPAAAPAAKVVRTKAKAAPKPARKAARAGSDRHASA
jgi:Protein of unknown function (DUF2934)